VYDLGNGQWDIPGLRKLLDEVLSRNKSVHDFEVEHTFPELGRKTMLLNARPFSPDSKHPELILLAVEDFSAVRERAEELAEASRHKDGGRDVVLIALTGWGKDEDRRLSQEAGFNFHIVKPVDLAALEDLLAGSQPEKVRQVVVS
jgi:CheY-like chemotaxis protein